MKLSAINNLKLNNKYDKNLDKNNKFNNNYNNTPLNSSQKQKNVNFTGLTSSLVNFWEWVEKGGRAISFTVEDMGGTNFPRTIMGMFAGFRYTHKINLDSLKQEGIREFLTGPTMTFMPMIVLACMKKMCGNSANTHIENLRNLSHLAQGTVNNGTMDEAAFINKVTQDLLEKTSGKTVKDTIENASDLSKEDVNKLAGIIENYKNTIADKNLAKKARNQQASNLLEQAQETFSQILKKSKDSYDGYDFLSAKYSISDTKQGATKFKDYVGYIGDYANDFSVFSKKIHNLDSSALINKFKNNYTGKRATTIFCMLTITAALMSYIPKLYTWASGGVNPNAKNIYNEADKKKEGGAVK